MPEYRVPFFDLLPQHQPLAQDFEKAFRSVFQSQHFILGKPVADLELTIASFLQVPYAIGCASGTDSLLLALLAIELAPHEGVITTPFTFYATAGAIARAGGDPLFVDIDPETLTLDPKRLADFLNQECIRRDQKTIHTPSGRTLRAIIPVHLFGQCADMTAIMKIAREWGLLVIEDAAQAIGATSQRRPAGSMGDFGCFSFFPTKNLGGMGDGGLVAVRDAALADRVKRLHVNGSAVRYHHELIGINSRLDTLQAALLLKKWPHLSDWTHARQDTAAFYDNHLRSLAPQLTIPVVRPENQMVYNQYCVRTLQRDALRKHLQQEGVGTEIYYPLPLHLQPCFKSLGYQPGDFPESEKAASDILALPIFPGLTAAQKERVVDRVTAFFKSQPPSLPA